MKHKHTVLLACACALAALVGATALRADPGPPPSDTAAEDASPGRAPDLDLIERLILRHREEAWRGGRIMGGPLTRKLSHSPTDPRRRAGRWRERGSARRPRRRDAPPRAAPPSLHPRA